MSQKNLEEIFKKAAEISKSVPANLQQVAFNRALDTLLNEGETKRSMKVDLKNEKDPNKVKTSKRNSSNKPNHVSYLMENLDRTKYQEIFDAPNILTSSLYLLKIIKDEHQIDGLGPTDISKILTNKFRIRTTRQAVSQALDVAGNKVDRVTTKGSRPYYRIMHNGEQYLNKKEFETDTKTVEKRRNNKGKGNKNKVENSKSITFGNTKNFNKSKLGSKKIMTDLIANGFFDLPKKIKDIQTHISHKSGYNFDVHTLASNLTRLLREEKLDREKSKDGQYEYTRK